MTRSRVRSSRRTAADQRHGTPDQAPQKDGCTDSLGEREIAVSSAILDQHCADVGRDPGQIRRSGHLGMGVDELRQASNHRRRPREGGSDRLPAEPGRGPSDGRGRTSCSPPAGLARARLIAPRDAPGGTPAAAAEVDGRDSRSQQRNWADGYLMTLCKPSTCSATSPTTGQTHTKRIAPATSGGDEANPTVTPARPVPAQRDAALASRLRVDPGSWRAVGSAHEYSTSAPRSAS